MKEENTHRWSPQLASLDANLLVSLDALLQEESVTLAAEKLGVSQSAMSQTLGRLRSHFDDPILVRVGRTMRLSSFAIRVRDQLHAAIKELESVVRKRPAFDARTSERRFVIASVDFVAQLLMPALRRVIRANSPGVKLALLALDTDTLSDQFETGQVDLYLGIHGSSERDLCKQTLFFDSFSMLIRSDHPMLQSELTPDVLEGFAHIHVNPRRHRGSIIDRAMREQGLERKVGIEVPFFSLVPQLLLEDDLIAIIPSRLAHAFAADYPLNVLAPPIELPSLEISMAWSPRFENEPGLIWLRETVAQLI